MTTWLGLKAKSLPLHKPSAHAQERSVSLSSFYDYYFIVTNTPKGLKSLPLCPNEMLFVPVGVWRGDQASRALFPVDARDCSLFLTGSCFV